MSIQNLSEHYFSAIDLYDFARPSGIRDRRVAEQRLADEVSAMHERYGTTPHPVVEQMAVGTTVSVSYV